jgi:hypothetical protein
MTLPQSPCHWYVDVDINVAITLLHHPARHGRKEFLAARTFQRNGVLGDVLNEASASFALDADSKGRLLRARIVFAAAE